MQTARIFTAALLVSACAPKSADTGGSSSSSGVETDGAEATSATNTGPTTGVDPTAPQTTTSASDDTGPVPTGTTSTTTGPDTDGLFGACTAAGVHLDACEPGSIGVVEQWIEGCNSVEFDVSRECMPAEEAKWRCVATLSCEEAAKFQAGEPTSCTPQVEAADAACVYQGCIGEETGFGDSCQHSVTCNGFTQHISCDADVCTCSEDDVTVADCPANGLCDLGPDELSAAITACCGWTP